MAVRIEPIRLSAPTYIRWSIKQQHASVFKTRDNILIRSYGAGKILCIYIPLEWVIQSL